MTQGHVYLYQSLCDRAQPCRSQLLLLSSWLLVTFVENQIIINNKKNNERKISRATVDTVSMMTIAFYDK